MVYGFRQCAIVNLLAKPISAAAATARDSLEAQPWSQSKRSWTREHVIPLFSCPIGRSLCEAVYSLGF